jgi:O-acetyl-ADP-ribose deacetylase (regulator of RNase III)
VRQALGLVVLLCCIGAAGCGGGDKNSSATTTVTTIETATATNPTGTASVTTHGRFNYPPVVVNNFMKSCTNGIKKREAYCECTLDKLSDTVSVQDFARIGLSGGKLGSRIQRLIRNAAVACADKL